MYSLTCRATEAASKSSGGKKPERLTATGGTKKAVWFLRGQDSGEDGDQDDKFVEGQLLIKAADGSIRVKSGGSIHEVEEESAEEEGRWVIRPLEAEERELDIPFLEVDKEKMEENRQKLGERRKEKPVEEEPSSAEKKVTNVVLFGF